MSNSSSFWDHPIEKLEEALNIRKQIAALQSKLSGLLGGDSTDDSKAKAPSGKRTGKRTMSPEARAKISAAATKRWAKTKGTSTAMVKAPAAVESKSATKAAKAPKKKSGLTAEGRARLAAAMKARWAARKKGAPALNAPAKAAKKAKS